MDANVPCCRERDLQRQIKLTKDQLRDLRASNETNQAKLLNQSERQGKRRGHPASSWDLTLAIQNQIKK